jgi:chemotaxis protein CheC
MEKDPGPILNDIERDALSELVNLGVSKAAANLRYMVADEVLLSVPSVTVVSRAEASRLINEHETGRLVAIHQRFSGDLQGRALLIFPETNSLELVKAVTGGHTSLDDIVDLEQEALSETGNIILNGCLGTIGNMLRRTMQVSLPEIVRGDSSELLSIGGDQGYGEVVLFLFINFSLRERAVRGYIAMLMDLPALTSLRDLLRQYIHRMSDETDSIHVES